MADPTLAELRERVKGKALPEWGPLLCDLLDPAPEPVCRRCHQTWAEHLLARSWDRDYSGEVWHVCRTGLFLGEKA